MNDLSFEVLLYGKTAQIVEIIMAMNGWREDEAIERFTQSRTYSFLEKEESKVWQYSPLMIAQLFNDERSGVLSFPEV